MAITRLADVIQPDIFTGYTVQKTTEKSELVQSGIVTTSPELDALASGPSTIVDMPFFNDLTGDSEVVGDDNFLTPGKIGTNSDRAKKQVRARAWGANGLSAFLSGADPMNAISSLVSDYWKRESQKILLQTLKGVFAAPTMASHVHDISALTGGGELVDGAGFVDATQKLGDAKELLTAVIMHSIVEAYLVKRQLIEYVNTVNEINQPVRIGYFMNKRVIVDDAAPFDSTSLTASMYLFGQGAIGLGNGTHDKIVATEISRDALAAAGEDYLINRKIFLLHPRGIKWTETNIADQFPTNAELADGTNWQRVYDPKQIRMVEFKFKITL